MAVAYRSSSKGGTAYNTSNLTLTEPSGAATGDFLVCVAWISEMDDESHMSMSGWSEIGHVSMDEDGGSSANWRMQAFYIERGASAPSLTVVKPDESNMTAVMWAVSGCTSGMIPKVFGAVSNGDEANIDIAVLVGDADCLVLGAIGSGGGTSGHGVDFASTMTEVQDNGINESGYHGPTGGSYDDPASTGTHTYTLGVDTGTDHLTGMCIVLHAAEPDPADFGYVKSWSARQHQYQGGPRSREALEPAGAAEDDVLVAFAHCSEGTISGLPTSWTSLEADAHADGDWEIAYIVRGASTPDLTFGVTAAAPWLHVVCLTGVDATSITSTQTTAASGTSRTSGTLDASGGGAVLGWFAQAGGQEAYTWSSDFLPLGHGITEDGFGGPVLVAMHDQQVAPASTEAFSGTGNTTAQSVAGLVFVPAAASGTNAPAGNAAATATANNATVDITAPAGNASATATAYDATVTAVSATSAPAENAAATATANDSTVALAAQAEAATATAAANDAATAVTVSAEASAATATAYDATVTAVSATSAPAENAAATATANDSSTAVTVSAEASAATATAYDATVTTSAGTNAPAENAAATATANDSSTAVTVNAEASTATATAYDATVSTTVSASAENASATASAYDATVTTTVSVSAENATVTATAYDATVTTSGGTSPDAENAAATATANAASVTVTIAGENAAVTASAYDATVSIGAAAEAATASVSAANASLAITVSAGSATATVTAYNVENGVAFSTPQRWDTAGDPVTFNTAGDPVTFDEGGDPVTFATARTAGT